uniref:Reverse transcriptase domain-containing protein n=1 Tax=Cyprinus carpio TaxID=7962 RepID=A0A8C2G3L7_CYPCA
MGKRGGIQARLTANPHKPSIPTSVLANVRSLDNKLDYIRLLRSTQRTVRDCCVFVFTETWLSDSVPDCAIQLDQLTCYRADRARVAGGKEFMIIKCRPFYLPREYTAILLVSVYIPPNNNTNYLCSFSRINARKAPGPDNIPGRVLRDCAAELTDVFTDIFNISLSQAVVPTCFKATTIIPVPKKPSPSCFNDYRPVALTPILMKCFERLVMHHIKTALPPSLDPFQFAYRSNRSTDDAISTTLHSALTHLEKKDSYVRMLFIDFSSAFNTIIPQQLIHKLVELGLNTSLCNWLLDFLTGRPQAVRVGSNTSSTITLNTGAPQGCVLSPLLFTLLTHDCTPSHNSNLFIKFADDTTVVGLISNRDETNYRSEVSRLAGWCSDNNLSLNVEKTKEIVVDFRRAHTQHVPLTINGATVERVSSTKFLGVHITEDLSWTDNTAALAKKSQQRLYFLRKLRRARAPPPIMYTFYRGTIESILTSCITVWYGACNASCRKTLQRIVRAAEKIIGVSLPSLQDIYGTRLTRKALCIAGDPTHPSHSFFSLLPSGRRLRSLQARTSRLKDSFIHQAVRKLNSLPNLPPRPSSASGTTEL